MLKGVQCQPSVKDFNFDTGLNVPTGSAILPVNMIDSYPKNQLEWFAKEFRIPYFRQLTRSALIILIESFIDERIDTFHAEREWDPSLAVIYVIRTRREYSSGRFIWIYNNGGKHYSILYNQGGQLLAVEYYYYPGVTISYQFDQDEKLAIRQLFADPFDFYERWVDGTVLYTYSMKNNRAQTTVMENINGIINDVEQSSGLLSDLASLVVTYLYAYRFDVGDIHWPGHRK